jgi:predicted Zn finger-like uncharacterized protein
MPIIVACPSCSGQLRIADDLIGRRVRCPACNTTFDATDAPVASPPAPDVPIETTSVPGWKNLDLELASDPNRSPATDPDSRRSPAGRNGSPVPKGAVEIDLSLDEPAASSDKPATRRADSPPEREERRARRRDEDEVPCPACGKLMDRDARRCPTCGERVQEGRRRNVRREFEEEEDEDRPRRRPHRRDAEPHRGGLILTFGIISSATLFVCWPLAPVALGFGIAAWWMGQGDLRKIRSGAMDPDGEGTTQAGWICGIVGVCLNVIAVLGCGGFFGFAWYMEMEQAKRMKNRQNQAPPAARRPF